MLYLCFRLTLERGWLRHLLYRYGFTDDVEHTMIGSAIHFNLRESRAKALEDTAMDNLWLELPWWF